MNDNNRNVRTLIVSFVVAIMVLIPLRFVEVGQLVSEGYGQTAVLGEETGAEMASPDLVLEEPYLTNEGEVVQNNSECYEAGMARAAIAELATRVDGKLETSANEKIVNQMNAIESKICR